MSNELTLATQSELTLMQRQIGAYGIENAALRQGMTPEQLQIKVRELEIEFCNESKEIRKQERVKS